MRLSSLFIAFFIFTLLFNCANFGSRQPARMIVDPTSGCSNFEGRNRAICESQLIKELQGLWNSKLQIKKIKSERRNDLYVVYTYEYKISDRIKFLVEDEEYEPTFLGLIVDKTAWFGAGYLLGLITGAQAASGK